MEGLFSESIILDRGRILLYEDCDVLCNRGLMVTGDANLADAFAIGRNVLSTRVLGRQKEIVLYGEFLESERLLAKRDGLTLSAPPLQDLFIHLTKKGGFGYEKE